MGLGKYNGFGGGGGGVGEEGKHPGSIFTIRGVNIPITM